MQLRAVLSAVAIVLLVGPTSARAEVREIRFPAGATKTTVRDSVVRGEQRVWSFEARAGQRAAVKVTALEGNAVFQIWRPGARITFGAETEIKGEALPGARVGDDARQWQGSLPDAGAYIVVVGSTRGNATYRLTVTVDPGR